MSASSYVFDVTDADFQTAVVERSHQVPVVVDFWAPWCGPCRALGPILERLVAARNGAVVLAKVNTDENPGLAEYFQIEGIPAVKAIKDGKLVLQFEGLLPEASIEQFLNQLGPNEADNELKAAAAKETTAPAEAEAIYNKVLAATPDHAGARLGLARLRLAAGDFDAIEKLLEPIPPGGDDGAEADRIRSEVALRRAPAADEAELRRRLATDPENAEVRYELGKALAAARQYPEALEMLYSAAERDRPLARGKVKETMVQIFHAIGVRSDLADEYRDKLQRVMY
jgi:putative thioredoxin